MTPQYFTCLTQSCLHQVGLHSDKPSCYLRGGSRGRGLHGFVIYVPESLDPWVFGFNDSGLTGVAQLSVLAEGQAFARGNPFHW